jgi:DNA-binding LacI/PurR family transcriptional regulator
MTSGPKYRQIYGQLRAEIAAGKYGRSGRLPSESQLVERFHVSRPTAARALRDLKEQGLIVRRIGSGSYVAVAEGLPLTTNRQLGLLIPGLGTLEILEVICVELARLARVHNYSLLWAPSAHPHRPGNTSLEGAEELCEQFIERKVSGVFLASVPHAVGGKDGAPRLAERLRQAGIAVVLLDRDVNVYPVRSDFDLVGIDNFAGGYLLAQHLISLGCRRMMFFAQPRYATTASLRIAGAREAMLDSSIRIPSNFVYQAEADDPRVLQRISAKDGVDAVICVNDFYAAVLLRTLHRAGVGVPGDVRVVGFDDVKLATLLSVPLTTMHQPCPQIAEIAFRAMLDRMAEPQLPPRTIVLTPRLVVRESCGSHLPQRSNGKSSLILQRS